MNDDEARAGLSHPYHIKRFFSPTLPPPPSSLSDVCVCVPPLLALMLAFDRH